MLVNHVTAASGQPLASPTVTFNSPILFYLHNRNHCVAVSQHVVVGGGHYKVCFLRGEGEGEWRRVRKGCACTQRCSGTGTTGPSQNFNYLRALRLHSRGRPAGGGGETCHHNHNSGARMLTAPCFLPQQPPSSTVSVKHQQRSPVAAAVRSLDRKSLLTV